MLEWKTETRRLGDLVKWEQNPRQLTSDQAVRLRRSIAEFGYSQLYEIEPDNTIIDGHQRDEIMLRMDEYGQDAEIEVRVSSRKLTLEERKEYIALKHKGAVGEWDWEAMHNLYDFDELEDWGFDADELLKHGFEPDEEIPDDPGAQVDKAEELREKWGVESGQLWQLGEHRLICGDCTDAEVVSRVMEDFAYLGITSPPYFVGKEYETETTFEQHLILLRGVADMALENIRSGGFFFVNFGEIAPQSHAGPLTGSQRQCIYPISNDYWQIFHIEREMDLYAMRIWYKPFNRLQQPFWSYHTSIPHHQEWEHIWTWRLPGGDGDECHDWDISSRAIWDTRNEATEDKPLTRHVAAFPVCLPERAIKAHSPEGAIIWEPFSGSGTTLIACERLNRKCRAVEISPAYCAVAIERWHEMTGGEPVILEN